MPSIKTIGVQLQAEGHSATTATVEQRTWTRVDANSKALRWGGGVFVLGLLMLPIPIVHFGVIPLYLIGLPMTLVAVYKLYSGGSDINGSGKCPSCGSELKLQRAGDDWPLSGLCPHCRKPYLLSKT